ncbi:hypothetical protein AXE80_01605 [Wenyingzhuangia fucanilytica]|uniref:Uncharacterized protein n=1 Tax=Wenyingzhuangia fucanilytica TaxID=1790137 RepID=A0A1B1Y2W2_9FLAO|nr:T9SS type A sorting domain-containing protein [Wenyingzhuangia fucanilytica]ANW95069.1 hypothetical protein AXE80_01605 [Wenyingzhuangia fucanilytica]
MKKLLLLLSITPFLGFGQNVINVTNGDFETTSAGVPSGWTEDLGTLTDGDAYEGSNGALLTSGSPNGNIVNDATYTLTGNLPTYLTVRVKPTANNDRSALRLMSSDGTTTLGGGQAVVWNSLEYVDSWHKILMAQYAPTSDVDVKVRIDNPIAGDLVHYDDVELVQNPLTVNGDMEIDFMANSSSTPQTQIYQKFGINPMNKETTIKRNGNNSIKCTTVQASAYFNQALNYQYVRESEVMNYEGSIWVKLDAASPAADFYAELWVDGVKEATGNTVHIDYSTETGWVEVKTPVVTSNDTPSGFGTVFLRLNCVNDGDSRAVFYLDDYTLTKAPDISLSIDANDTIVNNFEVTKQGVTLKDISGTIQVIDCFGRVQVSKQLNSQETLQYNFESATVYIVKFIADSKVATQKIIFE